MRGGFRKRGGQVSPTPVSKAAKAHNDILPFGLPLDVSTHLAAFMQLGEQVKLRRVCYSFKQWINVEIAEFHVEHFAAHVTVQDDCSGGIMVSTTNYHSAWFKTERMFC